MTQDANEKLTELAACPCCGPAKDEALGPTVVTRWNEVGRRVCCVVCRLCGLKTKDFDDSYTCNHAIAAWNRRTPASVPAGWRKIEPLSHDDMLKLHEYGELLEKMMPELSQLLKRTYAVVFALWAAQPLPAARSGDGGAS
jgi:hypothetical protein